MFLMIYFISLAIAINYNKKETIIDKQQRINIINEEFKRLENVIAEKKEEIGEIESAIVIFKELRKNLKEKSMNLSIKLGNSGNIYNQEYCENKQKFKELIEESEYHIKRYENYIAVQRKKIRKLYDKIISYDENFLMYANEPEELNNI